jgi:predicted hydrolase (HD superfamily)
MNRDNALKIVREFVKNENLVRHMLAVEAAMAAYAKKFADDEEETTVYLFDPDWETSAYGWYSLEEARKLDCLPLTIPIVEEVFDLLKQHDILETIE